MHPWMLQGLAVGCLLTAAAAVVHKETSKAAASEQLAEARSHSGRAGSLHAASAPSKLPTKLRGTRKDESYASQMRSRFEEGDIVTVGGQVNTPGPVLIGPASTLQSVIEKAGGATPFGAMNRVRLTRGKQVTEYNLRTPERLAIPVQPRDTIEVPQKMVLGQ